MTASFDVWVHIFQYWDNAGGGLFYGYKTIVKNYKKSSALGPVSKYWLWLSFISKEDYELEMNFYETEMKSKSYHTFNNKVKLFHGNIVVIEE